MIFTNKWIYRFRTWAIGMLLLRIVFVLIYHKLNIGLGPGTLDFDDYYITAKNVAIGNGFISPENNLYSRPFLGDNYYFAAEPGYIIFLLFFLPQKLDHTFISIFSNSLLYLVIMWLIWKSLAILGLKKIYNVIAMILLLINPHIIHYSLRGVPELLRMLVILATFFYLLFFIKREKTFKLSNVLFLGLLGGFSILVRMTFLLIPFLLVPIIIKYSKRKLQLTMIYILSIIIVLLPWVYWNYNAFGLVTLDYRFNNISNLEDNTLPVGVSKSKYNLALGKWRINNGQKFFKLRHESNADSINKMLINVDDTYFNWFKLYCLRTWELFKPFPGGGKLINIMQSTIFNPFNPSVSKIILQLYSLFIYLPWFIGLLLFISGAVKEFRPIWIWFGLGIISFIGAHLLINSPHSRYMLPLLPIGYITFFTFIGRSLETKFFQKEFNSFQNVKTKIKK